MPWPGRKRQAELERMGATTGQPSRATPVVNKLETCIVQEVQPLLSCACSTLVVPCLPTVSHLPLTLLERRRVVILTLATWNGGNVRLGKILAFEQQRLTRRLAQRVRKTVAKVEPGPMTPFAVPVISL